MGHKQTSVDSMNALRVKAHNECVELRQQKAALVEALEGLLRQPVDCTGDEVQGIRFMALRTNPDIYKQARAALDAAQK